MWRYARIFGQFVRTELQFELAYRANLLVELLQMAVVVGTSVGAVLVLFAYTQDLNGWTLPQMLVLLGVYYLVQGVSELVFSPSIQKLMEHIRLGTLDFALLKPANSQFLLTVRHLQVVQSAQVVLGLLVVAAGLRDLGQTVSAGNALGFVAALACGLVLVYALLLVLSTTAFWLVRVENILVIFWAFIDAGRFPVDVYPGWLRITMSTVVPIGVAVTLPAQAIAGRLDATGFAALLAGTLAAWLFAAWFWRQGLRSYTGASA